MSTVVSPQEWARRFSARRGVARAGAYDVTDLPKLELDEIANLSRSSGIHPDVLGPCRRAASKLNWIIMVRPIKTSAMFHVGDFDKLPKPMEVKAKCNAKTGMVMLKDEADFQKALSDGRINPAYAKANGLHLSVEPTMVQGRKLYYLVNKRGQRFFSDMDLFEVLNGTTGRQIQLGRGLSPTQGMANRRELDILINIMRRLGTDFALVQHGPERQWVKHDPTQSSSEPVTVFCPDGNVFILPPAQIDEFIQQVGNGSAN